MPLMAVKLRNRFNAVDPVLIVTLRNIRINGDPRGCSGFVTDPRSGKHVYVNTEENSYGPLKGAILYRTAESTTDYTGGFNRWTNADGVVEDVTDLLKSMI